MNANDNHCTEQVLAHMHEFLQRPEVMTVLEAESSGTDHSSLAALSAAGNSGVTTEYMIDGASSESVEEAVAAGAPMEDGSERTLKPKADGEVVCLSVGSR